jgi:uncharacterized membrane protein YphA (DoxX/SURF4 family)
MNRTESVFQTLRFTYGIVPVVAGLDKFTNLLADWQEYLAPSIAGLIPFEPQVWMYIVGVIEIVAGLAVLTRWTRLFAYVVAVWLVAIAVNLLLAGFYDVAVRDLVMAVGAWCLARLAEAREGLPATAAAGARA